MSYTSAALLQEYRRQAQLARDAATSSSTPKMRESYIRLAEEWDTLIKFAKRQLETLPVSE